MVHVSLTPSSGPSGPRLSDQDREQVIEVLKMSCADGRLTLDEFSERVDAAYRAVSLGELPTILADVPHPFGPDCAGVLAGQAGHSPLPSEYPVTATVGGREVTRWTVSIMGGSQRRGRWRLREKTHAVAIMGGCQLDMRNAEVEGPNLVVRATAVMGGIDIIVPEGIEVELGGIAIMGGKDARRLKAVRTLPGSPIIRVKAFAFWGSVSIRSKPASTQRGPDGVGAGSQQHPFGPGSGDEKPEGPRLIDVVAEGPAGPGGDLGAVKDLPEGTVTIMFSDIEGFTSVTEQLGDRRAMEILLEHNDIIRQRIARSGGHEVKAQGDGFMIAFSGASRALQCAVGIQSDFAARNRARPDPPIHVRLGLHSGEALRDGNDFMGGAVILAARITQQAKGGEILVSSVLKELCDLSGEFQFKDGRDMNLKGLSESRRVYLVTATAGSEDN
jgi:class 3 adenylate cyclase